ncbi:MAG: histidinol dehydrogenase [Spartobacteria bacterium AMD-G4]|nr:MAG: histidinol dehydrogenase [Spartobacteria bacterium AMD-G4]
MQILRPKDKAYKRGIESLRRFYAADPAVRATVEDILGAVAKEGDEALIRYTKKFGGPDLLPHQIPVTPSEISEACNALPVETRKAIDAARSNVRAFAKRSLRKSWFMKNRQGAITGERFDPFQRVGIYIPGGTAPLVSTAVMTCTLAEAAGVPEIVAVTPAGPDGKVHPALLAALSRCGATEIYRVGGAQAIAALAHGTKTILPVLKIFGPGNSYVVEAKRQVFGRVAIDLLPGPSEVLVIADKTAKPEWVAADLLAQAEHGHGSQAILVTDSEKILSGVEKAVERQAKLSKRPAELAKALKNTKLILVEDMGTAIRIANQYASEHVAIATESPGEIALQLRTSGAIFLGGFSPVAGGDFLAGPSHELPTGGAGRSFAGLTADQFQRRTSVVMFDEPSLRASLPHIETFSAIEGLDAHGRSASIRLKK